jgi:hypothetical protein
VRLSTQIRSDQLESYNAVDENVTSAIDDTHPAFTKTRLETITTCYDLTEHRIGCRSSTR